MSAERSIYELLWPTTYPWLANDNLNDNQLLFSSDPASRYFAIQRSETARHRGQASS